MEKTKENSLRPVFLQSLPVMAGYISLGIAYGILLRNAGYGVLWAFGSSLFVFAGSAQFLCVTLLAAQAPLLSVAMLVFLLNFRHFFYGLSMISRYKNVGMVKAYLIFALTDETFAILSSDQIPEGMDKKKYYFWLSLMDHCYWITGSVIGSAAGSLITFDTTGLDFAMTALFAVLAVEQWKAHKKHSPAIIGALVSVIALYIFGPDNFIIPALVVISVILLAFSKKWKGEEV